ncbi:DNA alkylation repair protein [Solwaraspora sp. WMMA2056]|uniref:DNA alkylation repair protein n=1 Tax=Solwaraspora sp. WMMA2056 TaxID=3015161 RepID=UPI00259B65A5|nr:DNA alkylation repair protein [Solwaraspora sp. WMMA2056]WJK42594.1 DNA alkylation repair protein [Solwaraspora sp. WMMA2056]
MTDVTAERFVARLETHRSDDELRKIQRYFKYADGDTFMGVRMGQVFALAKEFIEMAPDEIEKLLDSPLHEVRAGAVSIMSKQAARKKTTDDRRAELYELYLRRHDRIDNWDLVDLGAVNVVGAYLVDRPRDVLYDLVKSADPWQRRTSIVATMAFLRSGDTDDTYRIADILVHDDHDLVHKATGWLLRIAGDQDQPRLLAFLDRHAATMPRTLLRYAIEHLDKDQRAHYLGLKKAR